MWHCLSVTVDTHIMKERKSTAQHHHHHKQEKDKNKFEDYKYGISKEPGSV